MEYQRSKKLVSGKSQDQKDFIKACKEAANKDSYTPYKYQNIRKDKKKYRISSCFPKKI